MVEANGVQVGDVASIIFTTTPDLNAEFPALAAQHLGWRDAALLCGHEMNVPGSPPPCRGGGGGGGGGVRGQAPPDRGDELSVLGGVDTVLRVSKPYKLASREV